MYSLIARMMLRRGETLLYILSIALLVALPIATVSISNSLRVYLGRIPGKFDVGGLYLVMRGGVPSDSILDPGVIDTLRRFDPIECMSAGRIVDDAILSIYDESRMVRLRFVDDVRSYLKLIGCRVDGRIPVYSCEVLVGLSLAESYPLKPGDAVKLTVGSLSIDATVAGLAISRSQSDYEVIASIDMAKLLGFYGFSIVEFRFKPGVDVDSILSELSRILPVDTRIYGTRRVMGFTYTVGRQLAEFVYAWITPVYLVLTVSSYISSMNLIYGCSYELSMLKALGARRIVVALSIVAYVALTSILGSIVGLSIGLTGVQVASKILGWMDPSVSLTPSLDVYDATVILSISIAVSILGSTPHILRGWDRIVEGSI
ncbi:MAG: ABC transporter permease [Nitrososphaerota archaeon]|nr:ABC transporter permease [Candidatus Bathyarchaeota archaeon]MDW8061662.1 ABC transporter permease [Nitrososphaerota archaeon]